MSDAKHGPAKLSPAEPSAVLRHAAAPVHQALAHIPGTSAEERLANLRFDQRRRWLAGDRLGVEVYVAAIPELGQDATTLVDLIYSEYLLRCELGETPDLNEYRERFPHQFELLERQLRFDAEFAAASRDPHEDGPDNGLAIPELAASGQAKPANQPPGEATAAAGSDAWFFLEPSSTGEELGWMGPFRVGRLLGQGSMGLVFAAEDTQLRRLVALKVMKPKIAVNKEARRRFLREARAMAAVDHERIIPIYRVDEHQGVPYLAMPLLEGESLDHRLIEGAFIPQEVLRLGREMAEGLTAAHAAGLIHRDIKPANIWLRHTRAEGATGVEEATHILLLDFGLARFTQGNQSASTAQGVVIGTYGYMSPEQASGEKVDPRSDLFSLGCVLYQMATGKPPFFADDVFTTMMKLANEMPAAAHTLNPAVPVGLSTLIADLLAKEPATRPASAAEVAARLGELEQRPVHHTGQVALGSADEGRSTGIGERRFSQGWLVWLCLAGLMILLLGIGWILFRPF